jgi:hypothetical protein
MIGRERIPWIRATEKSSKKHENEKKPLRFVADSTM